MGHEDLVMETRNRRCHFTVHLQAGRDALWHTKIYYSLQGVNSNHEPLSQLNSPCSLLNWPRHLRHIHGFLPSQSVLPLIASEHRNLPTHRLWSPPALLTDLRFIFLPSLRLMHQFYHEGQGLHPLHPSIPSFAKLLSVSSSPPWFWLFPLNFKNSLSHIHPQQPGNPIPPMYNFQHPFHQQDPRKSSWWPTFPIHIQQGALWTL